MTETKIDPIKFIQFLRNNPLYFIENFLYIHPKLSGLQLFKLKPPQKRVVEVVTQDIKNKKPQRYIICKNRQVGLSTLSEALIFHHTIFNTGYRSLIVTPDREKSQEIFSISQTFYDNLPDWLKPLKLYRTKNNIIFENPDEKTRGIRPGLGSSITITHAKNMELSSRGKPLSAAHLSEAPFYDFYLEESYHNLAQSIPEKENTLIIVESTPNGYGGFFFNMYMDAKTGNNGFTPIFIPWIEDPSCVYEYPISKEEEKEILNTLDCKEKYKGEKELVEDFHCNVYQLKWRRENIDNKCQENLTKFRFENPLTEEEAFKLRGSNMFNEEARDYYSTNVKQGERGFLYKKKPYYSEDYLIKFTPSLDPNAPVEIFHTPKKGETYAMGVDPAYGMGQDFSAIVVLDKKYRVCATFYCNTLSTDEFREEIVTMGKWYNNALLNIETTGPGNGIMWMLKKQYRNFAMWEKWDSPKKMQKLRSIGWDATFRAISVVDNLLMWSINKKKIELNSQDLLNELLVFQYDPIRDRGAAPYGSHDDLIRALGLALVAIEQIGKRDYAPEDSKDDIIYPQEYKNFSLLDETDSIYPSWYLI